jgi:hypothetical protein
MLAIARFPLRRVQLGRVDRGESPFPCAVAHWPQRGTPRQLQQLALMTRDRNDLGGLRQRHLPERTAASVAGHSSTSSTVANDERAAATVVPAARANSSSGRPQLPAAARALAARHAFASRANRWA